MTSDGARFGMKACWITREQITRELEAMKRGGLRERLLKPKIERWGQLQEWEADKDNHKDDHRHVSHLFNK